MADREFTEFDRALQKSNRILNELEEEMGWQDRRSQAYSSFREVLHAIRDAMLPEEAVHFASQLPTLLAGVFIDGWKPSKTPVRFSREQFYSRIQSHLPYSIEGGTPKLVKGVWKVLKKHVSDKQLQHILANMPNDLAQSIQRRRITA